MLVIAHEALISMLKHYVNESNSQLSTVATTSILISISCYKQTNKKKVDTHTQQCVEQSASI